MDGFTFPVEIVRTSRRKSATFEVDCGVIKVRVPDFMSDENVRRLVVRKSVWMRNKIEEYKTRPSNNLKEYVSGENFPILGKNHRLKVVECSEPSTVELKDGYLYVTSTVGQSNPSQIQTSVEEWFKTLALNRLTEKTERYAKIIGVEPTSVSIKSYKSRWGSCSSTGDISYNWKIIVAPHKVVDYIVIHELCHLREQNHSPRFWRHVERYAPDWKECRNWLKNTPIIFDVR